MTIVLASKPGLSSTTALSIPTTWNPTWFRGFINNLLKGADVRNAVGANGITVTGTIASPYATISLGPGPIVISTPAGTVAVTINGAAGQQALIVNGSETVVGTAGLTALTVKASNGQSDIDIWAGAPNGGALVQGYNSTGTTRTGYLDFISGTGGVGGATETALDNDGTTANDYLSLVSGGVRRMQISGTGTITLNAGASSGVNLQQNGTNKIQIETNGNIGLFGASGTGQITGWGTPTGSAIVSNFPGATATLVQCSEVIARIITDLKGLGLYAT